MFKCNLDKKKIIPTQEIDVALTLLILKVTIADPYLGQVSRMQVSCLVKVRVINGQSSTK